MDINKLYTPKLAHSGTSAFLPSLQAYRQHDHVQRPLHIACCSLHINQHSAHINPTQLEISNCLDHPFGFQGVPWSLLRTFFLHPWNTCDRVLYLWGPSKKAGHRSLLLFESIFCPANYICWQLLSPFTPLGGRTCFRWKHAKGSPDNQSLPWYWCLEKWSR